VFVAVLKSAHATELMKRSLHLAWKVTYGDVEKGIKIYAFSG
jgi:hypothetical protein